MTRRRGSASWYAAPPAALLSAGLLVAAFPSVGQPWAAWVALVPWLWMVRRMGTLGAFCWSWLLGLAFFLGSLAWLTEVTVAGWLALGAFLALYFGAFGALARSVLSRSRPGAALVVLPAAWVALEYLRSHLLSGFGWNLLAYSQTPWLPILQVADLAGAWGVSYLIAFVNVALALQRIGPRHGRGALLLAAGLVLASLGYGRARLAAAPDAAGTMRVAVLQGNVPQEEKWDDQHRGPIMARYEALAREAAATGPDLIVWPETSMPGLFGEDEPLTRRVMALGAALRVPMLVGVPVSEPRPDGEALLNSAVLLGADGHALRRYDKLHLVPFGEFLPLERFLPWLREVLPPIGEFLAGADPTVFRIPGTSGAAFSVLICFEDVFPQLAREFVRQGARALLVITNDAWFGPTGAAYQHAQASTLRAVELRRPVARAANTGWSGCIDPHGRWTARVRDEAGRELFVPGTVTCEAPLTTGLTVYAAAGDWLPLIALGICLAWLAGPNRKRKNPRSR